MKAKMKVSGLFIRLLRMNLIPIILLSIVIIAFSAKRFESSLNKEVHKGMMDLCNTILTMYDTVYVGDYSVAEQDGAIYMFKGDYQINGSFDIIDQVKASTGADITIFYRDTRVITTLRDSDGKRMVGTGANAMVLKDVLEDGNPTFYPEVLIDKQKYFAYYTPLINSDGTRIGMMFVGKPTADVKKLVWDSVSPIIWFGVAALLLTGLVTMRFSSSLLDMVKKTESYMERVANGDFHIEMDPVVLKSNDEFSGMCRYIIKMQRSLRDLVELDMLTNLLNRRSGEKKIRQTQGDYTKFGAPFCLAIGDIDFFKKVNDTYGHDCGDFVLLQVAQKMREHMRGKGYAIRWGGEEFLMVFRDKELDEAAESLEKFLNTIRETDMVYDEVTTVKITMTFGITEGGDMPMDDIIKEADGKLYIGKNAGRNQIVK